MKGQAVTIDFIAAFFIFLGVFLALILTWSNIDSSISESAKLADMERSGIVAADSMVKSIGYPPDWTPSSVKVIGISDGSPGVVNSKKVGSLLGVSYNDSKSLLAMPYDFHLEINKTSGSTFVVNGTEAAYGVQPSQSSDVVVVKRFIFMDGEVGIMTMRVWS